MWVKPVGRSGPGFYGRPGVSAKHKSALRRLASKTIDPVRLFNSKTELKLLVRKGHLRFLNDWIACFENKCRSFKGLATGLEHIVNDHVV
jgi:hypothetical protein